jgi:hypothetical protein
MGCARLTILVRGGQKGADGSFESHGAGPFHDRQGRRNLPEHCVQDLVATALRTGVPYSVLRTPAGAAEMAEPAGLR